MVRRPQKFGLIILRRLERFTKTDIGYFASGGTLLLLEQVAAAILAFGVAVAFGHLATPSTYGNYKYVLSLASLFTAFSLSGIATAVTQATAQGYEGALKEGFALSLRGSVGILILCISVGLYYLTHGNAFVAISLCLVAAFLPLANAFALFDNFLIGRREFGRDVLYTTIENLVTAIAVVGAILFGAQAIFIVAAYFLANTIASGVSYWLSVRRAANAKQNPDLLTFGAHLSLIGVVGAIADKIDTVVVFTLLGPGHLAVYAYAIAMPEQIKALLKNLIPLSMPKFARRSIAEIKANIWRRLLLIEVCFATLVLAYVILAPVIFHIFFPIYSESISYSQLYSWSILAAVPVAPLIAAMQAHKATSALYVSSNAGPVVLIMILPPLVYMLGIEGAIIAQIIFRVVSSGVTIWQFNALPNDIDDRRPFAPT